MTATALRAGSRPKRGPAKLRRILATIAKALDAYATYRLKKAVPFSELERADRTIRHFRHGATRPAPAR